MATRSTYTYALLEVSSVAYEEIAALLRAAGYDHVFHEQDDGRVAIDLHGIALIPPAKAAFDDL